MDCEAKEIQGVLNEKQEEVWDEEALKVWENSFKKLGLEDLEDKTFDRDFAKEIVSTNETFRTISERASVDRREFRSRMGGILSRKFRRRGSMATLEPAPHMPPGTPAGMHSEHKSDA